MVGGDIMSKFDRSDIPYLPVSRDFYDFAREVNNFDPLGSYTGKTREDEEKPVQDADDL